MTHFVKIGKQLFNHSGTLSMVNGPYLGMVKTPLTRRHVGIFNVLAFAYVVIFDIVKSLKTNDFRRAKIFARFSHAWGVLVEQACEKFSHAWRFFVCKLLKLLGFTRAKLFARLFARLTFGTPEAVRKIEGEYPLKGVSPNFRTAGTRDRLSELMIWSFGFLLVGYLLVGGFRFDLTNVEKLAIGVDMSDLTEKQKMFVAEYLVDLNATQAAIRAGYSEKTAKQIGSENLTKPDVLEAIEQAQFDRMLRTEITQDMVLEELAKIAFSDIRKISRWGISPIDDTSENADPNGLNMYPVSLIPSEQVDDDTAAAISEISLTQAGVKIKLYDKKAALVDIGKHLGMFVERTENVTTLNVIENEPVSPEDWENQHTSE